MGKKKKRKCKIWVNELDTKLIGSGRKLGLHALLNIVTVRSCSHDSLGVDSEEAAT